jgi:hypothetical protein
VSEANNKVTLWVVNYHGLKQINDILIYQQKVLLVFSATISVISSTLPLKLLQKPRCIGCRFGKSSSLANLQSPVAKIWKAKGLLWCYQGSKLGSGLRWKIYRRRW